MSNRATIAALAMLVILAGCALLPCLQAGGLPWPCYESQQDGR